MDDVKPLKRGNPYAGLKFHKKTSTATLLQGVNKRSPGPTFSRMDGNEPNHYQQPGANGFNTVIPLTPASRPLPDIPSDRQAVLALNVKIETSPCDTPTAKSTSSPGKRRSVASTLASASKRKKLNNVPHSRQHKPDGMGWSIVKSVTHPTSSASEPAATNPRQWLESREDLYSMALSRLSMCNGISMTDASKVVVVVDQESGINLSLESNILEWALSIKREFLHHPPQSSERAIYSVPSLGTEGKTPVTFQTSALRSSGTPLREHSHDGSGTLPNAPNAQMEDRPAVTSHALSMVSVSPSGRYPSVGLFHPAPHMQVVWYPNINGFREKQVDPIASQRLIHPYKSNLAHHWSNRPSGSASLGPNGNTIQGGTYTEPPLEPQSTKNISSNNSQLLVNNYPTNDVRSPLEEETITQDLFRPLVGIFPSNLNALVTLPSYVKAPNKSATMITDFPAFLDARLVHDELQPPVVAPKIFTARTLTPEMPPYVLAPVEVCQLLDALRFELPIVLIASHDSLQNVGVKLDPKFAYSVAGCFQVKQVQNQRRVPTDAIPPTYMESEWKFVIRWIPGGETSFCPYNTHLYSPWWSPTNNSTHDPDNSPDVLPSDLVGDRRSEATGWHCSSCGKVNHQMLFRHLRCSSSFCKNEPAKPLQPITLAQIIKNPQDKLGMAKPSHSKFNAHVQGHHVTWEDGMQTFKYQIRDTSTFCSHVFTGNAGELQDEASTLFRDIQTEIQLTFDGIYFTHSQTDAVSEKAPKSLKDAQDWLMHTVKTYSDIADVDNLLRLRTLSVMAWWKEGKRRTASQLQAKSQPVALACFGNSLTVTLTRQSSIKTPTRKPRFGGAPSGPSPASATSEKQEPMDVFGPTISTQQDITAIPAEDFVVSMVHGDVLCVFGDDFEYNLKRNGTGMILIGTS